MKSAYVADCDDSKIYATAASDGERVAVIAANYDNADTTLTFELCGLPATELEIRVVDEEHNFEVASTITVNGNCKILIPVKNNSFVYVGSKI